MYLPGLGLVEVSKISAVIKSIAKELNVPAVVLAELNRLTEIQDKPKLIHLMKNSAIGQDADIVMFLDVDPQDNDATGGVKAELEIPE